MRDSGATAGLIRLLLGPLLGLVCQDLIGLAVCSEYETWAVWVLINESITGWAVMYSIIQKSKGKNCAVVKIDWM